MAQLCHCTTAAATAASTSVAATHSNQHRQPQALFYSSQHGWWELVGPVGACWVGGQGMLPARAVGRRRLHLGAPGGSRGRQGQVGELNETRSKSGSGAALRSVHLPPACPRNSPCRTISRMRRRPRLPYVPTCRTLCLAPHPPPCLPLRFQAALGPVRHGSDLSGWCSCGDAYWWYPISAAPNRWVGS